MKPLIIANWKMNISFSEAVMLAQSIDHQYDNIDLLLAPPTPYLTYFAHILKHIKLCAQDISTISGFGAFTGQSSAHLIKSCGIDFALVGHSESRTIQQESSSIIRDKINNCFNAGLTPIICIGEPLAYRTAGTYHDYILEQVNSLVHNSYLSNDNSINTISNKSQITYSNLIIAYEPLWAIGSGTTLSSNQIKEIIMLINSNAQINSVAQNIHFLYGGSVNSQNFKSIIEIDGISGVLIGSASLKMSELKSILSYN